MTIDDARKRLCKLVDHHLYINEQAAVRAAIDALIAAVREDEARQLEARKWRDAYARLMGEDT